MKQSQFYKKSILFLFGMLFLTSPIFSAQTKQNKDLFNAMSSKDLALLSNEYHALEMLRGEVALRAAEWYNTERENQISLTKSKIFISLGANCAPARQFEKKELSEAFFPFDWCVSAFESIYKALETEFQDYLKLENLEESEHAPNGKHRIFRDTFYNISFPHDFSLDKEPLHDYEHVRNKYYRRIDRFYRALTLGKKVYFFRTGITKKEAQKLNKLLRTKFPELNYTLVVVNDTEEFQKKWRIKHIKNFFVQGFRDAIMRNRKLLQDWDTVFQELKIIPKSKPQAPPLTPLQKKRKASYHLNQH